MPRFSLSVETTSNATAGAANSNTAVQFLMAANREARIVAVGIFPQNSGGTQTPGSWVIDRISAVASGSALVPLKMDAASPVSAITDTAKTISTTLGATNTSTDAAILMLQPYRWNVFAPNGIDVRTGPGVGFALRRATAPSGAQIVNISFIFEEL